jgi:threonine dehydrogenase-like Zn-dependent dehydrogenase
MPLNDPEIAGKAALVVECSGYESAVRDGFRVVRTGGEVVLVGTPWRRLTDTYAFDICRDVFFKFAVLRSGWEFEIPLNSRAFADMGHNSELFNNALHSYFPGLTKCLNWLVQGKIPLEGLIRKASPKEAPEIYRALLKREIEELFVVWDWTSV